MNRKRRERRRNWGANSEKERKERKKERRSISCTWSTPAALKNCMIPFFTSSFSYFISSSDFLLFHSPFIFLLFLSFSISFFFLYFFLSFCFWFLFDPGRVGRGLRIEVIEYVMYDCIHTFSFMIPVILSSFFLLTPSFFLFTLFWHLKRKSETKCRSLCMTEKFERNFDPLLKRGRNFVTEKNEERERELENRERKRELWKRSD